MSLPRLSYKRLTSLSVSLSLPFPFLLSFPLFWSICKSKLSCCKLSHREAHMARNWGQSWPIASGKLRPLVQQPGRNQILQLLSELRSRSVALRWLNLEMTAAPADTSIAALRETLSGGTQLSCTWIPDLISLWNKKNVC